MPSRGWHRTEGILFPASAYSSPESLVVRQTTFPRRLRGYCRSFSPWHLMAPRRLSSPFYVAKATGRPRSRDDASLSSTKMVGERCVVYSSSSAINVLTWQSCKALVRRRAERLGLCGDKVGVFETRALEVCFAMHHNAVLHRLRLTRFWGEYVS